MQISKLSLIVSLAGAAAWQLHAQPASPELQDKAVELLRQTISQSQSAPVAAPTPAAPAAVSSETPAATATTKVKPAKVTKSMSSASSKPAKVTAPTVPEVAAPIVAQPAGPKSKQERLADLLEAYRADRVSPTEYHAERAKILAEP